MKMDTVWGLQAKSSQPQKRYLKDSKDGEKNAKWAEMDVAEVASGSANLL